MSATINRDEWMQALVEAGMHDTTDDQGAVTYGEFAAMFDLPQRTAERRLQALEKAGKATRTRKIVTLNGNRRMACVAYRLASSEKKPKRKSRAA